MTRCCRSRRLWELAAELTAAIAKAEESNQLNRQALMVCEKWARLSAAQLEQLAAAHAENLSLWAALSAPKELQQFIAAGCSEAQAKELARAPGRSVA